MEQLRFPLFVNLTGKTVVVVGGGTVGGRRAEMLATFGAEVTVYDPAKPQLTGVTVLARPCEQQDLAGVYLCIIATGDRLVNQSVATMAKEMGALVNVADDPQNCDFFFPAICQGETLVAGVVGNGRDHHKTAAVAKKLRRIITRAEREKDTVIKVGSRDSRLAVVQSQMVMDTMCAQHPALQMDLVTMKTTGDMILDRTLDKIGGKGLFVKELDLALLDGRVDITVHSCKDLPMEDNPQLPLVAFPKREDPRDVLVLPAGVTELDPTKPIGCSSKRRAMQLKAIYPHMEVAPVRGNVLTRLEKLDRGDFSALVLAAAGIHRLKLTHRISRYFTVEEILPAGGQGILAVQARVDMDLRYIKVVDDPETHACALAERAFVRALDGGCSSPVAAFAQIQGKQIYLRGMDTYGNHIDGWGDVTQPASLGEQLGMAIKSRGENHDG